LREAQIPIENRAFTTSQLGRTAFWPIACLHLKESFL